MSDESREIKASDERYYAMFSDEGNLAMHSLVSEAIAMFERHGALALADAEERFRAGLKRVEAAGHTECQDTAVRDRTSMVLTPTLREVGLCADDAIDFFNYVADHDAQLAVPQTCAAAAAKPPP